MSLKPRVLPKTWRQEQVAALAEHEQRDDVWFEAQDPYWWYNDCYECTDGCYWCGSYCAYDEHLFEGGWYGESHCHHCGMPESCLPDPLEILAREGLHRFGLTLSAVWPDLIAT